MESELCLLTSSGGVKTGLNRIIVTVSALQLGGL